MPLHIREPKIEDKAEFIAAMEGSKTLHYPWVVAPVTSHEFEKYFQRFQQPDHKSFLVFDSNKIVGVFNISQIIRGVFQSAYLGFYAVQEFAGKGLMSAGLKLVLDNVFREMELHRLEANIQPDNIPSIKLVKKNRFRYEGFSPRYLKINNKWRGHERWAITQEDYISDDKDVLAKDHIEIVSCNPSWIHDAGLEIKKIKSTLPSSSIVDVQHVGSTAVPGLSAKPIIDIQIAVRSLEEMKIIAIPALQKLGYEYWDNNPDPGRLFFAKGMPPYGEKRTHHVHIVEPTSKHWSEKIRFRDYLISHPEVVKKYEDLKIKLSQKYRFDREEYTNAKGDFIQEILKMDLAKSKN